MALEKITEAQLNANGVIAAPDILSGSAATNKAIFDRMVRDVVAPAYNACVDAVNALQALQTGLEAQEQGRVTAETARVQAELERVAAELQRATAETERQAAEEAREDKETGYVAQAENAATEAESWAKGGTGSRDGEDADNAKYYAEQARQSAGGDFVPNSEKGQPRGVATLDINGKVPAGQIADAEYIEATMLASGWTGNTYSFEADYPHAQYNIEVGVAKTATVEQFDAFCEARIGEDTGSNVAVAVGDVPTVDIPIIIKAVRK